METSTDDPERQLNERIKVLVDRELGYFHWRDAQNRRLCDRRKTGVVTPYKEVRYWADMCLDCQKAVDLMAEGWQ